MKKKLFKEIQIIEQIQQTVQEGIKSHDGQLKRNMTTQFADPYEFIREYVVNAYDANAAICNIFVNETNEEVTIEIADNGHGMDRKGIISFFTLFDSHKPTGTDRAVGQFGVGKLSVAAVSGQKTLEVMTSTGRECWIAKAKLLLSDDPIELLRVTPVPERGTRFTIVFSKKESLEQLINRLERILIRYLSHLPINIRIHHPAMDDTGGHRIIPIVREKWLPKRKYARQYHLKVDGASYDIVLEMTNSAIHQVFQKRVFISQDYNLLCFDQDSTFQLPHIRIKLDSASFKLPFGRHRLAEDTCLRPVAKEIRENILPRFFDYLLEQSRALDPERSNFRRLWVQEIAAELVIHLPGLQNAWSNTPIFKLFPNRYLSLAELEEEVTNKGKLYIAREEDSGVDYTQFDAPVLSSRQLGNLLQYVRKHFSAEIINLTDNDIAIEAPAKLALTKTKEQRYFESHIGFDDSLNWLNRPANPADQRFIDWMPFGPEIEEDLESYDVPEIEVTKNAFTRINWRANHLVGKDGTTPCTTRKFITIDDDVVLNLFHPDIEKLVQLSKISPKLAGHWAMALCLVENNQILPHLSASARENLMMVDALAKINDEVESAQNLDQSQRDRLRKDFRDLLGNFNINLN